MDHRDMLKRVAPLRAANAARRAWQIETRYRRLMRRYVGAPQADFEELFAGRGLGGRAPEGRRWRVLFCGTDERQDYGGFIQSLGRVCDLKVLTRIDGKYGQALGAGSRDTNRDSVANLLRSLEAAGWRADLLMMQAMGERFRATDIAEIKRLYGVAFINVGMDERLAYELGEEQGLERGISALNEVVDLALVTAPEIVDWYLQEGVPAKYFPLASDGQSFCPLPDAEKAFDVGFVGSAYGKRRNLARRIEQSGLTFQAYGPGWPSGPLPPQRANEFYNTCRVVLGSGNIGYSSTLMNPKLRDFEAPLTGVAYITNYTPELSRLFTEGVEILLYRSDQDLVNLLLRYCATPGLLDEIGKAGRARVLHDHTLDKRFSVLFNELLAGNPAAEFA